MPSSAIRFPDRPANVNKCPRRREQARVPEHAADFVGSGVCHYIEIFWLSAQQKVSDPAARQTCDVAPFFETIQHLQCFRADAFPADIVL